MRCPSCGTENAPDSRFCGGCGAKQPGKTAPTAKILDDASYPATGQPSGPASIPPGVYSTGPASIPPASMPPASIPPPSIPMPTPAPGSMVRPPSQPAAYGSIPPTNDPSRHISRPPDVSRHSPAPSQQRPNVSAPAVSRPQVTGDSIALPPRRPVGLIALVLVIDLGLAAAGAVMLAKGLSSEKPAAPPVQKTEVTPVPEAAPEAPAPAASAAKAPAPEAPAPEATAAAPSVPSPTAIAAATGSAPAADHLAAAKPASIAAAPEAKTASVAADKSSASRRAKEKERGAVTSPSGPKDPYTDPGPAPAPARAASPAPAPAASPAPAPSPSPSPSAAAQPEPKAAEPALTTEQEIARLASTSKAAFDRCAGAADAHGTIQIAFQVLADGRIANAAAVENSTGNTALAQCLVSTMRAWTLSPHSGSALSFVRPFNYP